MSATIHGVRAVGDRGQGGSGLIDFLFDLGRSVVADARAKLIDEGWFGRRAPDTGGLTQQWARPTIHDGPTFDQQWAVREPGEREQTAPGADRGIDR